MQAIYFPERGRAEFGRIPEPLAGPGDVVVEVRASGICHTDFEVKRGNYGVGRYPIVPGHEFAGEIVERGPGVTAFSTGDRVVIDPNLECGKCQACLRGWAHLCDSLGAYGVTVNGGFAERCVVSASAIYPIGDLGFDIAALAEPMGCVLNGIEAAGGRNARSVLIFGAGPMGLMMAIGLRTSGVGDVTLVDPDESRLDLGRGFGFKVLPAGSEELGHLQHAFDLVVDATGVTAVAARLPDYVANGGTCHFFGICPSDARIPIAPFDIFRRQLKFVGSHSLNHNIPEALAAIRAAGPGIARLVSHRLPLEEVGAILSEGPPRGSLKVQASRE